MCQAELYLLCVHGWLSILVLLSVLELAKNIYIIIEGRPIKLIIIKRNSIAESCSRSTGLVREVMTVKRKGVVIQNIFRAPNRMDWLQLSRVEFGTTQILHARAQIDCS